MRARVYLETSVISYLTSRSSRDLVVAAHQQLTADWWQTRATGFDLVASLLALQEAARGDHDAASRRLTVLSGVRLLEVTTAAEDLALDIVQQHVLPDKALADALHIGVAAVHEVEYLLTWNCGHIANAELLPRVTTLIESYGYRMPFVCTPEELLGEGYGH